MRAAPRPANISTNDDADCEKNCAPDSWATALASSVLPVPGGPWSRTPLGTLAPRRWNGLGSRRKSTTSCSSALASSTPAMSSQPTSRLASRLDLRPAWSAASASASATARTISAHEDDREDGLPVVGEVAGCGRAARRGATGVSASRVSCRPATASARWRASSAADCCEQRRCSSHARCIGTPADPPASATRQRTARRAGSPPARRGRPRAAPRSARACPARAAARGPGGAARARSRCRRGARTTRRPRRRRRSTRAGRRRRPAATGARPARAQQRGAGQVGGQQRRHQVRAAAVVLLGRVARVVGVLLVGADRLVLDAVVGGEVAAAQGDERRARARARRAAASPPTPRVRRRSADRRRPRPRHRGEHGGVLEGQARLGQRALDERDHGHRLAQADHAAHAGDALAHDRARAAWGPRRRAMRAVGGAHGRRPVRRAVHEQAVAQRHAAEAQLLRPSRSSAAAPCVDVAEAARGEPEVGRRDALVGASARAAQVS